ncbi:MAG: DUF72 domain-containing protein [Elusimicrobia bacterium]|nr:DUF72 domain-containing protein [Candidatus Obscuribacterium magneticum]
MLKIGCSGFPVGQNTYFNQLKVVEMTPFFQRLPRISTLERWRREAPKNFEFVVVAPKTITHPLRSSRTSSLHFHRDMNIGHFKDSPEVREILFKTLQAAEILQSRMLLFDIPPTMPPQPEFIGHMQKFFSTIPRKNLLFFWTPPKSWPDSFIERLSKSLQIYPATNPLVRLFKFESPVQYFRLGPQSGSTRIHTFSRAELSSLKHVCQNRMTYVFFNNGPTSFQDALQFRNQANQKF